MDFGAMTVSDVLSQLDDGRTAYKLSVENGRARLSVDGKYGRIGKR